MKLTAALHETYLAALPDAARKAKADRIRQDLVRRLEKHVPDRGTITPIGSAKRKTDVAPIDDIDLFIELKATAYPKGDGPRSVLKALKKAVEAAYSKENVTIRSQKRSIRVDVPGCPVPFDLVPGVITARGYELPDVERGAWIRTDPRVHVQRLADADKRAGGDLRTLIRLVKLWRTRHAKGIGSFHLEVLCWSAPALPSDRVDALAALFDHLSHAVRSITKDPGGVDGPALDRDLAPGEREKLSGRFAEAAHALRKARLDEQGGAHTRAHRALRHLFGSGYPSAEKTG